ncbi:hypothetical protein ABZP36_010774 [Zizania latifolia]
MIEEMYSIESNRTWRLVPLPHGHWLIELKWVYKVKKNAASEVVKHKTWLIVKGYIQQSSVDFDEVFMPVAYIESVQLLLALAAQEAWPVHHMDVKPTFHNGELVEEVYIRQPPSFIIDGHEDKVLRLDKALYRWRQALHAWNAKIDETLVALGFSHSASEHAVYAHSKGTSRLLVGVYVDDLIITGNDANEIAKFKQEMSARFKMSDLCLLYFYLGIEVHQGGDGIELSQTAYVCKILERTGMLSCNPYHTPIEAHLKLSKTSTAVPVDAIEYRGLIGCLRYLVHTRPDIAFTVGYVSRFMENPTIEHLNAMKRILRYIAGTIDYGCYYKHGGEELKLLGYNDADMGGDIDIRKSTTGVFFFLGSCPVTWQSQKQKKCIGDGKIDIKHVRTEEQIANILTKPLSRDRFYELRTRRTDLLAASSFRCHHSNDRMIRRHKGMENNASAHLFSTDFGSELHQLPLATTIVTFASVSTKIWMDDQEVARLQCCMLCPSIVDALKDQ